MVEKHNFEVNPLQCPRCQGRMRVIAFIEDDFTVSDILIEHMVRKLECDCLVLLDERGIVENEPRFVFSMVLLISFLSIGLQFRKSLLIKYFKIDTKLKMVLSCYRNGNLVFGIRRDQARYF